MHPRFDTMQIGLFIGGVIGLMSINCINFASQTESCFKHKQQHSMFFLNEERVNYYVAGQRVGFIGYTKIPFLPYYAVHSLYVYPEHRNKGYGRQLLTYACDYLASINAQRIYIQPGPFEIDSDGYLVDVPSAHELKMQLLIDFYKKHDFAIVDRWTVYSAHLLYKLLNIYEDSNYLMVKTIP
jgi:GNAT superfamily N-acetyltransferase